MFPTESACSSDCGKALPRGFSAGKTTTVEIPSTKNQPIRHYNVHLPTDYQNNREHAIVFSFHGRSRDMYTQEDISGLSQESLLVNGVGIIAVYPQGIAGKDGKAAWQGAPYSAPDVDDILFVNTMISQLESTFCLDATRIYATGKSNGAGFINLLAHTPLIAGKFAAFATVSAAFYTTTFSGNCPSQRPIPIVDLHGTDDTVAPYNGREAHGGIQVGIDNFLQGWVARNGCVGDPIISHLSKEIDPQQLVEIQTWNTNRKAGSVVIGYKIRGGQHAWPRTTLPAKCNGIAGRDDCSTTVFDATLSVIIPFFNNYSLQLNQ